MKIVYIHGLGGAANQSSTFKVLRSLLKEDTVLSPEIPHNPKEGLAFVRSYLQREQPDVVLAASMGGFLTLTANLDIPTIVINPAMDAYYDLLHAFGLSYQGEFKKGRSNEEKFFILDDSYYKDLREVYDIYQDILKGGSIHISTIYGVFGENDELFHHIQDYQRYYNPNCILTEDMHSISAGTVEKVLLPKIKEFATK